MSYLNLLFSLLTVNEVSWKDIRILESHLVHLPLTFGSRVPAGRSGGREGPSWEGAVRPSLASFISSGNNLVREVANRSADVTGARASFLIIIRLCLGPGRRSFHSRLPLATLVTKGWTKNEASPSLPHSLRSLGTERSLGGSCLTSVTGGSIRSLQSRLSPLSPHPTSFTHVVHSLVVPSSSLHSSSGGMLGLIKGSDPTFHRRITLCSLRSVCILLSYHFRFLCWDSVSQETHHGPSDDRDPTTCMLVPFYLRRDWGERTGFTSILPLYHMLWAKRSGGCEREAYDGTGGKLLG